MKYRTTILLFALLATLQSNAQIFPDLEGQELIDALVEEYKTDVVLSYNDARDTLYSRIDNINDTVYAVYTRFPGYVPPGTDPTQALFADGGDNSINTEHTWPRSKGAQEGTLGHSDMHHLFATRSDVNGLRGNDPFGDINDNQTDRWFYLNMDLTSIPLNDIDEYSEYINGQFEPREDHKGNVARAMMYFYTMYRNEAEAADPTFFTTQREDLCVWHFADPADEQELERNVKIANYQGGKINPFIEDCSLAWRTYCPEFDGECLTSIENIQDEQLTHWSIVKSSGTEIVLHFDEVKHTTMRLYLLDRSGRDLGIYEFDQTGDTVKISLNNHLTSGVYYVNLVSERFSGTKSFVVVQ